MTKLFPSVVYTAMTALLMVAAPSAMAQQPYPTKPVRLVVPYAPGGSTDILARLIAQKLTEAWGQQVLVDNRGGGATVIGTENVAKSPPDGYTLLLASNAHVVIPQLTTVSFDPIKDFVPIAAVANTEVVLLVNTSVNANTLKEFIALAKARPGDVNYASAGNSSATHLAGEQLASMADIKLTHIPYKGSGPGMADLVGGQVQASFQTPIVAIPHIKTGKVKALAVSGARRPQIPDVPTFAEAGLPGFNGGTWFGILAPAGTPKPIVDKVAQDIKKVLDNPEFKEKLLTQGLDPVYASPEQFAALMKTDTARFSKIIKSSNIKLQ